MLDKATDRLVNKLIKKRVIKEEEYELYQFGIETAFLKGLHLLSYFILGLLLGRIMELIIFLAVFIPLREYSGGYHASTKLRCYIVSCMTVLSMLVILRLFPRDLYGISIYLAMFSGALLFLLIPVETKNKPLDDSEKIYYKSKAGFIIVLLLVLSLFLSMMKQMSYSLILALGLFYELIAAIAGKLMMIAEKPDGNN
ncbi:accessory gene regulator ArgB-like protein [Anaerocolumna xylanovorans]|uniref:Accessory gene regulator B n=1 Tax=Anaerocolumna xylanovorans DSM 12503 TaxID=1121345 RepID=A0A1M7YCJ6_9FIRM|nr:accessory gene regulator B family protein [Anaerocolumna xylanovorans]SHO50309.1 accessory gene regulator B [Anaerocolumna xylanovorans DSM 12503]